MLAFLLSLVWGSRAVLFQLPAFYRMGLNNYTSIMLRSFEVQETIAVFQIGAIASVIAEATQSRRNTSWSCRTGGDVSPNKFLIVLLTLETSYV